MVARRMSLSAPVVGAVLVLGLTAACHAGLLSYWPLDDGSGVTALNAQAGMPNGTLVNTEAGDWVAGHTGGAGDFAVSLNAGGGDPVNEYINYGTNATLDALNTDFSVQSWVRTNDPGGWFRCLVAKYGLVGSQQAFWGLGWMGTSGNPLGFYIRNASGANVTTSAPSGSWGRDNLWHQVLGVRGNGRITLFGDGEVLQTQADTIGTITNARVISSGTHNLSQYVREAVDDVAIWDHRLSPQEARLLATGAYTPLTLPTSFSKNPIEDAAPAAYWRMEETITGGGLGDWSGNDYHLNGFNGAGVTKAIAHPLHYDPDNRAMRFDGSSGYFANRGTGTNQPIGAALRAADFTGADGSYSIELWFNADTLRQGTMVSLSQAGTTTNYFLILETEPDGTIRWLHRVPPSSAAGGTNLYSSTLYTTGDWHYLAAVKNGTEMKMYIDGMLDPNEVNDPGILGVDIDVAIGRMSRQDSSRYFDGMLDEIAFYDRALTYDEIYAHFTGIAIPEPASLTLLGIGALGLLARRRRRPR